MILWRWFVPLLCGMTLFLPGCAGDKSIQWQGYVEGDFVYVSPPLAGRIDELAVRKGDQIEAGALLFRLEDGLEQARLAEAGGNLARAEGALYDLEKGARPSEIAALEARLHKALEAERLAELQLTRQRELLAKKSSPQEIFDQAKSARIQAGRQVEELRAELATARLGGREDAIAAARAAVQAAAAVVAQARWNLEQKRQLAPCAGLVFDTIHLPGEWIAAGRPVISLLPAEGRKVRFYVPEPEMAAMRPGYAVQVLIDGLEQPLEAVVRFVSPQAEYTPPVIYSSQSRAKLVFLVEAGVTPEAAPLLKPGQPVDVRPVPMMQVRTAGDK